jgi:hypothetical protein
VGSALSSGIIVSHIGNMRMVRGSLNPQSGCLSSSALTNATICARSGAIDGDFHHSGGSARIDIGVSHAMPKAAKIRSCKNEIVCDSKYPRAFS